ncbi:GL17432 [Drosophila persimilis]|uniref:lysozyme n=7 Tax=Sophophora TaxID=32341 RepID=A0A6I8VUG6_DROPS|nr:lysozyme [Drosophila pseudoobscura]XP_033248134.1 lysozyme isoform X2 [Drosophila miranda]EDW35762.1 GL17432 [Drosophila persimilis]
MANQMHKSGALVLVLNLLLLTQSETEAKLLTRCQLAKELLRHDFPRSYLSNWVCLVESESGRSTSKSMQLPNQSVSYGLFQINSKNWCRKGRRGGICNIKCEEFLNDEISDDSRCAMQIFNRHGFQAWPGWMSKCRGRTLPDVSRC